MACIRKRKSALEGFSGSLILKRVKILTNISVSQDCMLYSLKPKQQISNTELKKLLNRLMWSYLHSEHQIWMRRKGERDWWPCYPDHILEANQSFHHPQRHKPRVPCQVLFPKSVQLGAFLPYYFLSHNNLYL